MFFEKVDGKKGGRGCTKGSIVVIASRDPYFSGNFVGTEGGAPIFPAIHPPVDTFVVGQRPEVRCGQQGEFAFSCSVTFLGFLTGTAAQGSSTAIRNAAALSFQGGTGFGSTTFPGFQANSGRFAGATL